MASDTNDVAKVIGGAAEKSTLRIALLTYRGNPYSGGQGVYVRELAEALTALGHAVTVFSGPPYPDIPSGVSLVRLPSLDLYRPEQPFRPARRVGDWIDLAEYLVMCTAGYPEPLTFSLRAWRELGPALSPSSGSSCFSCFDIVHDNQSLGYGLLGLARRVPVLATIHHPITVDLQHELAAARTWSRRWSLRRWYSFVRMQRRVARRLQRVITVSEASREGIAREMGVAPGRIGVVPNGVDSTFFLARHGRAPVNGRGGGRGPGPADGQGSISARPARIVTTASADVPLKGLAPLLLAYACLRRERQPPAALELVVVGKPKADGPLPALLREYGLEGQVRFSGRLSRDELVDLYSSASVAVVPSLYEGFSLPAAEAMACGTPLVATSGGALPEVVGPDGDSALVVPPGEPVALARAVARLLDDGELAARLGERAKRRARERFSWRRAAELTVEQYRRVLDPC